MSAVLEPRWACLACDEPVRYLEDGRFIHYHDFGHDVDEYDARSIPYAIGSYMLSGLSKLNEEAGELVQVIGKLMATGGCRAHWSGDLREKLVEELSDVLAAGHFFADNSLTPKEADAVELRTAQKRQLFQDWHDNGDPPPVSPER